MQNSAPTYPDEYHLILQALPEDGSPVAITMRSAAEVQEERLKYYNFLKWCRRPINRQAVSHLAGRYNEVTISCKDNQMIFRLKTHRTVSIQSPLAQAIQQTGIPAALPPLPVSANPNQYAEKPKYEATPLMPEFEPLKGVPQGPGIWDSISAADKKDIDKRNAVMIARSAYIKEHGIEEEVKAIQWYPKQEIKSLPQAWKRCHPQFMLQEVMDDLVFSGFEKLLSFPIDQNDMHLIDTKLAKQMTQIWSDYFIQAGMMDYISFTTDEVQWRFNVTESFNEVLDAHQLDIRVRRNPLSEDHKNEMRRTILNIFNQEKPQ